ncbi:hypothetical protein EJ05DRAFT_270766 [Pseudovirgaria hyperparasitica]|uniref:Uncharacterized protein n=1 Tax=Pseudovirgaria hyperparasitica TaxID=470096 RepID=A0A6A6VTR1_9PEZI|nr:uncharacterized protein EJ05DRAFT_270766 [Pseudovirgaria hyperparasitica]KAF2752627.1 hypothetical protein EJ05DRAFT_270766 [Pseudovirgaria hyperparasitica]
MRTLRSIFPFNYIGSSCWIRIWVRIHYTGMVGGSKWREWRESWRRARKRPTLYIDVRGSLSSCQRRSRSSSVESRYSTV